MRHKIVFALNILIIAGTAAIIVWQLFFAEERDIRMLAKAGSLFLVYLLAVLGIRRKRSVFDYKLYEEKYRDILKDAFKNDRRSYKKLMSAISQFNGDEFKKAEENLCKLEKDCVSSDDFSAVLMFRALCLEALKRPEAAAAVYEELLVHDVSNASAWSNLGLLYQGMGKADDAFRAYRESIVHNPDNAYAYNNIASHYIRCGEPKPALENALKAIKLNSKLHQAMSAAALAYKMLGDDENAEKYCRMYGANGGNAPQLRQAMERIL
ncbi:MAG: tetratricopeptide repeat protein [Ruminococcus sp.]|nr:tetratricopeptide repeat protein [Ruminococcus sp.]